MIKKSNLININNMRIRSIFFMIIILLSISCFEKSNNLDNSEKKNRPPLFMGLSPDMTDQEFEDEINNLNFSGKLQSGHFVVKIDEKYWFNITKDENSISLFADNRTNFTYADYDGYIKKKEIANSRFKEIIKKIEDKYKDKKNESLTNMLFKDISLEGRTMGVYRDLSKTVSIQFNYHIDDYDSEQHIKDNYEYFSTDERGRIVRSSSENISINISYYYNDDFDKILKKKIDDKIFSEQNEIEELKRKEEKEKVLENNLKDL